MCYERLNYCERVKIHKTWCQELYALAKVSSCAIVQDNPNDCCPCVKFVVNGCTKAVAYLHSDNCLPTMHMEGEYMRIDYRTMLAVLYGNFADVSLPAHLN